MINKLASFIVELATVPDKMALYRRNPETAMKAAGLSEQDKAILRNGDWNVICEFLGAENTRPIVSDRTDEERGSRA